MRLEAQVVSGGGFEEGRLVVGRSNVIIVLYFEGEPSVARKWVESSTEFDE